MKRPVVHSTPRAGEVYEWDGNGHWCLLTILTDKTREGWMWSAIDLDTGQVIDTFLRSRDLYNGWRRVA